MTTTPTEATSETKQTAGDIAIRVPTSQDAAEMSRLIHRCEPLEPNTTYAYLLFCTHFADTCVVACDDEGMVGAVVGYCPPSKPDAVFVWQIASDKRARGKGLGSRMLDVLTERLYPRGVRHLEATVAPSNTASDRLFRRFAEKRNLSLERIEYFDEDLFGGEGHEAEFLYRIGLETATTNEETPNP